MKKRHSAGQIAGKLRQAGVALGKGGGTVTKHIRSDNGPEFVAKDIQRWLHQASVATLYIQKASPWENGYVESFNGKPRDELLNRELFLGLPESCYVLDECRLEYNHRRPHSGLDWQTPASFAARLAMPSVGATRPPPRPSQSNSIN